MIAARAIEVPEAVAGIRLDAFLADELRVSRRYAQRLIARDIIRVDGRPGAKGARLGQGARVEIPALRHPDEGPLPSPELPLVLLAEANGLVAVAKPAGVACHPLDFDSGGTVLNAFVARFPAAQRVSAGALEGALVHRLDTGTSGALVLATRQDAHDAARAAFAREQVEKRYRARVHGALTAPLRQELWLAHAGARMRVTAHEGQRAVTLVSPLAQEGDTTLVDVVIPTGVRHQIRATLAHLGHPIVGDALYGSPARMSGDGPRHLLHALQIRIDLPLCALDATAPPPPELEVQGLARADRTP